MAAPNIVALNTLYGKTAVQGVSTTPTDIIANTAASGTVIKVNLLSIANINGTTAATVNASVYRSGVEYKLAHLISVPAGASLVITDKASSVYLEEGDSLRLTASVNSYLHAVCSYEVVG